MLLKRLYDREESGELKLHEEERLDYSKLDEKGQPTLVTEKVPQVIGVTIKRPDKGRHNFSPRFLERGMAEGWLMREGNKITLKADNGTLVYTIERTPGYFCCHCKMPLDDGAGKAHVQAAHKGEKSPDPNNPAGYRKDNFYACVREVS